MIRAVDWIKLFGFVLVSSLIFGCAGISQMRSQSGPELIVDGAVYDFEYAGANQTIEHTFKISHTGKAPVALSGLSVCCGCAAQLSAENEAALEPGQTATVRVACTMPLYEGAIEKVISLHTASPNSTDIKMTLKGVIRRDVAVVPPSLFFGELKKGETAQKRFRVLQMSCEGLDLQKVEAGAEYYAIDIERFDALNHRGYEVTVGFTANIESGIHRDVITIVTNDKRRPKIDVPIVAQVID
jgi:hypothetical protein